MAYRYEMYNSFGGSERYGDCEVCKGNVATTFHQVEEKEYIVDNQTSWTREGCSDLFGHKKCLINRRRK